MIRVLQCVNNMHRAGLETMLMNYYRAIDRTKIQFDFLMHRPERSDYDDEIESLGGRIFRAPRLYPQNYPAYFSYMKQFFQEHPEYKIIHSHIDAMSCLPLLAAKKAGVPIRIAHSHNTAIDKDYKYLLKQFFRFRIPGSANHFLACGKEAGAFLFRGRSFDVIPNAIHADRFLFDESARCSQREALGLQSQFVVGHIGRFSEQKNHVFLTEIFAAILQKEPDAILLLIGTGEKEQQIREKVNSLGISRNVRFLGNRSDVAQLYQAMDVFLLPSRFEGIPLVGVEAQFAGLPCFFSSKVPDEVAFAPNARFLDLKLPAEAWADKILQCRNADNRAAEIEDARYDISYAKSILEAYYLKSTEES